MDLILDDDRNVMGQIYLITNSSTHKRYIGQTLTHRKNRGKYRPFGYIGRFNDHISEAICNSKKKQCSYLNNAIRLYGKESFHVELILTCPREDLDIQEKKHIEEYSTLFPNGYNLTIGGKVFKDKTIIPSVSQPLNVPKKRGGCLFRSKETRAKMTNSLKIIMASSHIRHELMERTQKQHYDYKMSLFKGVDIDKNNIDKYIHIRNKKNGTQFIKVIVGKKSTSFVGKYQSINELKQKAINFLTSISTSATLPNCSGNP
jgi:hypothetical protein